MVTEGSQYEILGLLGAGSYGTVYKARYAGDHGFSKDVALKILKPEAEDIAEVAERLRDEARMLGLVHHRAIVQVDRLIRVSGRWAVVMECADGPDLARVLRGGALPVTAALEIAAEVAGALHAAWTQPGPDGTPLRLLHRDLKPSNIVLTRHAEVKVLDFGVARADFATREARTRSLVFGTPAYMPPERLDFQPDGPEGDVYALCAILYELLAGRRLGLSSANPARHQALLEFAHARLREDTRAGEELSALVLAGLAFARDRRPSVTDLLRQLPELNRRHAGPTLRVWAEEALPGLLAREPQGQDKPNSCDESSTELASEFFKTPMSLEQIVSQHRALDESAPKPEFTPTTSSRRKRAWAAFGGLMAAGALVGLVRASGGGTPDQAEIPEPTPGQQEPGGGSLPPVAEPQPPDPHNVKQATRKERPAHPTSTATLPKGILHVAGDATSVRLVAKDSRSSAPMVVSSGESPALQPGLYRYAASFQRFGQAVEGDITLHAGESLTLNCVSRFGTCKVSPSSPENTLPQENP